MASIVLSHEQPQDFSFFVILLHVTSSVLDLCHCAHWICLCGTKLMEVIGHHALSVAVYRWDTFPFLIHVDSLSSSDGPVS